MSAPRVRSAPQHPGRWAGLVSLLMVPALAVSFTAAELAGSALQSALGLDANESLTTAGALGAGAAVLLALLLVVPQLVGVVLGSKARRLGERRIGTAGVVLNSAIALFMLLTMAVNLLFL
jgi:hypothetical protein